MLERGRWGRGTAVDVVPLYARLSSAEQHRVFERHAAAPDRAGHQRRRDLADRAGHQVRRRHRVARISRYSCRTKVQRLPIEPVSQASANQRSGRCGRVEAGIAIRLYSEEDYGGRPEFTDPEILRTNLASVILQMTALGLGDVARFPFVDPPDRRQVTAGVQLLEELGALAASGDPGREQPRRLTKVGRQLAALPGGPTAGPDDPRGRAARRAPGGAGRSPRRCRCRTRGSARSSSGRRPTSCTPGSSDERSDFLTLLNLWRHVRTQQRELSSSAFRRMCRSRVPQLPADPRVAGARVAAPAGREADRVSTSSTTGSTARPTGEARRRGRRPPGAAVRAALARRPPRPRPARLPRRPQHPVLDLPRAPGCSGSSRRCVMAAELVETSRLFARVNAAIEPEWAERLGAHLVKRSYSEPHWSRKRVAVMAHERVTLYGVPLVADRLVSLRQGRPRRSPGSCSSGTPWSTASGRPGTGSSTTTGRCSRRPRSSSTAPAAGTSSSTSTRSSTSTTPGSAPTSSPARTSTRWWKRARQQQPDLLTFDPEMLVNEAAREVRAGRLPRHLARGRADAPAVLPLRARAPRRRRHRRPPAGDAQPAARRRAVVAGAGAARGPGGRAAPVAAQAAAGELRACARTTPASSWPRCRRARSRCSTRSSGTCARAPACVVPREAWDWAKVPAHLRPTYRVVADDGAVVSTGKDLAELKAPLRRPLRRGAGATASQPSGARTGQRAWTFGTVERSFEQARAGHQVQGLPRARRRGHAPSGCASSARGGPGGRPPAGRAPAARAHRCRPRRPAHRGLGQPPQARARRLAVPDGRRAARRLRARRGGAAHGPARRCGVGRGVVRRRCGRGSAPELEATAREVLDDVVRVLAAWRATDRSLSGSVDLALLPAMADMRAQVGAAGAPRVRRRRRRRPAAAPAALPRRRASPARAARRRPEPRPGAHGPGATAAGGLPPPRGGAAGGPAASRSPCAGCAGCSRSTASACGRSTWHRRAGLGRPDPQGAGRAPRPASGGWCSRAAATTASKSDLVESGALATHLVPGGAPAAGRAAPRSDGPPGPRRRCPRPSSAGPTPPPERRPGRGPCW